jgi:hypothetical protein
MYARVASDVDHRRGGKHLVIPDRKLTVPAITKYKEGMRKIDL